MNAIVCEIDPARMVVNGIFYAGNCEQRVSEMVDAWNELKSDQTPVKVLERIVTDIDLLKSMAHTKPIEFVSLLNNALENIAAILEDEYIAERKNDE